MRPRSGLGLLAAACLLFLTGGPTSLAQSAGDARYAQFGFPSREPVEAQARRPRYPERGAEFRRSRNERAGRQPEPQAPPQPTVFNPFAALFNALSSPPPPQQPSYQAPRVAPRYDEPRRVVRPRPAPVKEAVKPKANVTASIVVFGDSLAELVGQGLDDAFEEARQVNVIRRTRADSGLVQTESYDWPKAIRDYLAGPQKTTIAVLMMGVNDHEPIREGEVAQDFLSERWRQLYRDRLDAVLQQFKDKNVPVVFVGAPPMKNEKLSTEQVAVNEIALERVQRAGGVYVDIWPAFVDDQNRYAQMGPNLAGQVARLRLDDGVHFTKAGARKAAHFAEIELRRLIEGGQNPVALAKIDEAALPPQMPTVVPAVPEAPPVKPVVGPVLPLTRIETSPGGALASGRPRPVSASGGAIERAFGEGVPPPPQPGRADDFRWPRS